ncbi:GIY-YIG nuclease family protein [Streptomyces sp. ST2-7A]|uniref:GIY-YIG nuclease family protein n=1 Tax=Streptomyces sp. ST2-7A TaxID=2907214 RepID=UPI001F1BAF3E|nr:GIY-YIG nuclease family protein [Streptomyces sp. ST2-7A]MCE7081201.1 GIY-YIG nuclease family protein [Streptomyces sp. ST2-7A]
MTYSPPPRGRTAVYRIYDRRDRLLYIGVAVKPEQRIQRHNSTAAWWMLARTQSVEWFATRAEAELQEMRAVRREGPLYNSVYSDLFEGSAADARAAIPAHLERVECQWAWGWPYAGRVPPPPARITFVCLRGRVEKLTRQQATETARRVREAHPERERVWREEAEGVPERWADHAVVAYAVRLGLLKLEELPSSGRRREASRFA